MENWKKVILRAAGFGAGFAIAAALIGGALLWWSNRPPEVKPWNDKAITASYDGVDTEGTENTYRFVYTLENKTNADFRVQDASNVHLAALLQETQALSFGDEKNLHTDYPIYVPAKSRVRFIIHLGYPYPIKPKDGASTDEQHDFDTRLAQYVTKELSNIDGFTLLDETSRYKIVMPNGWAERAKQPMRIKPDPATSSPAP